MKKILLMLVALVATVTASAQEITAPAGWATSFVPVTEKAELAGVHTAVAADGSIYVSSTYNKAFNFGPISITDPDGLTSSVIFKVDQNASVLWAVTLAGSCTIQAMTADTDGTLYVAGTSKDEKVVVTGVDGKQYEIVNPTAYDFMTDMEAVSGYSAFVIRIDPNGAVACLSTIQPSAATPEDLMNFDKPEITPMKLVLYNEQLYVACAFYGNVTALGWQGAYVSMDAWLGTDLKSYGLFSLSKGSLSGASSVVTVQRNPLVCTYIDGVQEEIQNSPEAFDFLVDDAGVFFAFIGYGNLRATSSSSSKDFEFEVSNDGSGNNEHGLVMAYNTFLQYPKVCHAAKHDKPAVPYNLVGMTETSNSEVILGGTFYGNYPLDNSITKEANTSFVTCIAESVKWNWVNEAPSEATCMVVTGEEIHTATEAGLYTLKTANGELLDADNSHGYVDADSFSDKYVSTVYTTDTEVWLQVPSMKPSGINEAQAQKNGAVKYYNLNGIELTAPQHGLNIVKTADGTRKVLK